MGLILMNDLLSDYCSIFITERRVRGRNGRPSVADRTPAQSSLPVTVCAIPAIHAERTTLSRTNLLCGPDFTVPFASERSMQAIDSCEYIWESGVGFTSSVRQTTCYDQKRIEILHLLLTCFSSCMNLTPRKTASGTSNKWIEYFSSNRHDLPVFTSLLNTIISYDRNGILPFNHLLFTDPRESLVDVCIQILIATYLLNSNRRTHLHLRSC